MAPKDESATQLSTSIVHTLWRGVQFVSLLRCVTLCHAASRCVTLARCRATVPLAADALHSIWLAIDYNSDDYEHLREGGLTDLQREILMPPSGEWCSS